MLHACLRSDSQFSVHRHITLQKECCQCFGTPTAWKPECKPHPDTAGSNFDACSGVAGWHQHPVSRCRFHFVVPAAEGAQSVSDAASLPGLVEAGYLALHPERAMQLPSSSPGLASVPADLPAGPGADGADCAGSQVPTLAAGADPGDTAMLLTAAGEPDTAADVGQSASDAAAADHAGSQPATASALVAGGQDLAGQPLQVTSGSPLAAGDPPAASAAPRIVPGDNICDAAAQSSVATSMDTPGGSPQLLAQPLDGRDRTVTRQQPKPDEPVTQASVPTIMPEAQPPAATHTEPAGLPPVAPAAEGPVAAEGGSEAAKPPVTAGNEAASEAAPMDLSPSEATEQPHTVRAEAGAEPATLDAEDPASGIPARSAGAAPCTAVSNVTEGTEAGTVSRLDQVRFHA